MGWAFVRSSFGVGFFELLRCSMMRWKNIWFSWVFPWMKWKNAFANWWPFSRFHLSLTTIREGPTSLATHSSLTNVFGCLNPRNTLQRPSTGRDLTGFASNSEGPSPREWAIHGGGGETANGNGGGTVRIFSSREEERNQKGLSLGWTKLWLVSWMRSWQGRVQKRPKGCLRQGRRLIEEPEVCTRGGCGNTET